MTGHVNDEYRWKGISHVLPRNDMNVMLHVLVRVPFRPASLKMPLGHWIRQPDWKAAVTLLGKLEFRLVQNSMRFNVRGAQRTNINILLSSTATFPGIHDAGSGRDYPAKSPRY